MFILLCHSRNSNIYLMLINHLWQNIYFLIVLISFFFRHKIGDCIACFMNFSLTLVHHDYNVDYFVRKFSRCICTNSCLGLHPGSHHIRYGKCDAIFQCFDVLLFIPFLTYSFHWISNKMAHSSYSYTFSSFEIIQNISKLSAV